MSTPETRQPCQAGPARTGRTGLGANGRALVPKLLGGHGPQASLSVTPQLGNSAACTPQTSPGLGASPGIRQGVLGAKWVLGGADGAFSSPFSGLHCLLNSEQVAAPLGNWGWCDPRAVSTVPYPVHLGTILWCSRTPQGLEQAFCKGPASPCDRCPTASQGQRGHAARQHVAATLCCPHLSRVGPWGACHKAEGDKMEPGCVGMGGHSLCCPWGSRSPVGTAGWLKGCCRTGMGTARGRAQLRLPPGQLSGSGWLSTAGKHFGTEASKSSPAVSGDPKGMDVPGTALSHVPEPCQPPAGPRRLPWTCASAGGTCSVLAVKMCQHPATRGGHGKVLAWPVGGPPSPVTCGDAVPGAVTRPPLFAQPARVLARGSWILFAKCLERLG